MKTTIGQLTIPRTFYKRDKDAFGNRTKEPYQKNIKRKIKLVTGWTRFAHYLIDAIIISLISFGFNLIWVQVFISGFPIRIENQGIVYNFIPKIEGLFITVAYYFICEYTMQRTIGKFATSSVVINKFAEAPEPASLLGRSFSRIVPFEALSYFSDRGWHDRWSKTYVVTNSERDQLKQLLNEQQGNFISDSEDLLD